MLISKDKNKMVFESDFFNLSDTLECGQVFRYYKTEDGYGIISKDKYCRAATSGGRTVFESDDIEYFYNYFALDEDYESLNKRVTALAPELADAAAAGRGIRLLRQDPFEMVVSFIISANNNIPRIKGILNRLAQAAGRKYDWGYAFPAYFEFLKLSEADFKDMGAGYRAAYLHSAVRTVTPDFIAELLDADTEKAMRMLLSVKGVGKKVADCIMLFGLSRGDTFPVDTWMEQALKSDTLDTNEKIRSHYIGRLGGLAGLAQQYIYHYKRNISSKNGS